MRKLTLLALSALIAMRLGAQSAPAPATPGDQPAPAAAPAPASSGDQPAQNAAAGSGDMSIKDTEAPKSVLTKGAKDTLSVDFPNEDIHTILRNVADLFELNLVIPDTLQGRASIKLRDVTWHQIFQVVLTPVGYTYVADGNIIKVVSVESLQQEPTTTEVFILNYAKAADIQPSLLPLVDAKVGGKIQVDSRANALIITERPSQLNRIRPILTSLDKPTAQVMIESKFLEVTDNDVKNIGVDWSSLSGYAIGTSGPITNVVAPTTTVGNTLKKLFDTKGAATATFTASQFQLVLGALQSSDKSRLVSNPTVVTLNNTEAFINIGQEYPVPAYQFNQQTGSFEVSGFDFKDIGVILKVTPQVNAAGFIRLSLQPEVSSTTSSVSFGGAGGASIPIIDTRRVTTQVTLKDGSTLGIGGLIRSTDEKKHVNVPLLGEIPFLGRLFRSDNNNGQLQNLLIFITAKTIDPEGATVGEVFDPRVTRQAGLQKEDLPGYRDGSDSFVAPEPAPAPAK